MIINNNNVLVNQEREIEFINQQEFEINNNIINNNIINNNINNINNNNINDRRIEILQLFQSSMYLTSVEWCINNRNLSHNTMIEIIRNLGNLNYDLMNEILQPLIL